MVALLKRLLYILPVIWLGMFGPMPLTRDLWGCVVHRHDQDRRLGVI